jgi:alkylhydroperoxidase family enzyme
MVPWLSEVVATLPGLVRSYGPNGPLDPRTREQVILAVTEVNGCRYCAWIHGSWQEFLGDPAHVADAQQALMAYARSCAEAGRPLPADDLAAVLPPEAVRAVRATVAQIEVSNLVGNTVDGLLARLTRKRPLSLIAFVREAATVAVALPIAVPLIATAGAMRVAARLAPPLPEIDMPPAGEANLLVHLLAAAAPAYLSNAVVRLALLGLPRPVAVGIRAGRTAATVRIGRGRLEVENGISRDAVVVVEGEVEPLLQLATGSIVRELSSVRIRPS